MSLNASAYLSQAAELVARWLSYAPLEVVLGMPDVPTYGGGPSICSWQPNDQHELTWTFRYAGHPLDGVTVPRDLFVSTFDFREIKRTRPFRTERYYFPNEVYEHIFVHPDFRRVLTKEDLLPYLPRAISST